MEWVAEDCVFFTALPCFCLIWVDLFELELVVVVPVGSATEVWVEEARSLVTFRPPSEVVVVWLC